jgi:hypothetical protein
MRTFAAFVIAGALPLLAACGKHDGAAPPAAAKTVTGAVNPGLPPPDCSAKPAADASAPDVAGLHLGISRDAALDLVRCRLPQASVELESDFLGNLNKYGQKLGKQAFIARVGESVPCDFRTYDGMHRCGADNRDWKFVEEWIHVAAPGMPGHETVVAIWRTQRYREGSMPTAEAVLAALREKYGEHQYVEEFQSHQTTWRVWVRDTNGVPMTQANPLFTACAIATALNPNGEVGQGWSAGCGLTVKASIERNPRNPELVRALHVVLIDQDKLISYGDALQEELAGHDRQRRDQETKDAQGSKVTL